MNSVAHRLICTNVRRLHCDLVAIILHFTNSNRISYHYLIITKKKIVKLSAAKDKDVPTYVMIINAFVLALSYSVMTMSKQFNSWQSQTVFLTVPLVSKRTAKLVR